MKGVVILAVVTLAQTTVQSSDNSVKKEKVMFYMWALHINPNNNLMEYLGKELIRYGFLNSNCLPTRHKYEYTIAEQMGDPENNIWQWKKDLDLEYTLGNFYDYYILPEGEEDALVLWYNLIFFFDRYQILKPLAGFHTINQMRGCPIKGKLCDRSLVARPNGLQFTERQCEKVDLFLRDLSYRLYKTIDNPIPFTIPFDYYTIGISLLKNLPITNQDINNVNKEEKIFQFEAYIKGALQVDRVDCIKRYSTFLSHRKEKEALIEADLKDTPDESAKKKIEKRLKFYKEITNMMEQGWEYVNK